MATLEWEFFENIDESPGGSGRAPVPKSSGKGWEYCPSCGGVLDTGWECLSCKADWRGFAALHPGIEPAPEPERSCGACLFAPSLVPDKPCDHCDDFSEWTDG